MINGYERLIRNTNLPRIDDVGNLEGSLADYIYPSHSSLVGVGFQF